MIVTVTEMQTPTAPATTSATDGLPPGRVPVDWRRVRRPLTYLCFSMSLLGAGFCGGLSTYSAFAVQTHERGPRLGTAVAVLTLLPAVALCALGFWVGQA